VEGGKREKQSLNVTDILNVHNHNTSKIRVFCVRVCFCLPPSTSHLRPGCARSNPQWHSPPPSEAGARPTRPGQRGSGAAAGHGDHGSGEGAGGGAGGRHVHQLPPPRPRSRRARLPHWLARRSLPPLQPAPRRAAPLLPPLIPPRPRPVRQGTIRPLSPLLRLLLFPFLPHPCPGRFRVSLAFDFA
jgi:hypothetical protein